MKLKYLYLFSMISAVFAGSANANWQYSGNYMRDSTYKDDGSRFVMSVRGGASIQNADIKNDIGSLTNEYYVDPNTGTVVSAAYFDACVAGGGCGNFLYAGQGDIANLPAAKDFRGYAFAVGASLGWTMPKNPQWRFEFGWDHITETEYNATPMFEGNLALTGGDVDNIKVNVKSGSVHSTISTDIFSMMAFYDFFDGMQKPLREFIPYIGFGFGYADTETVLNLTDLYGDLSADVDLRNFGTVDEYGVLQFYPSKKNTGNIASTFAFGLSYGISESMYLDFGARFSYIPSVKWALSNEDASKQRGWFSASNLIYSNIMMGIRFEF